MLPNTCKNVVSASVELKLLSKSMVEIIEVYKYSWCFKAIIHSKIVHNSVPYAHWVTKKISLHLPVQALQICMTYLNFTSSCTLTLNHARSRIPSVVRTSSRQKSLKDLSKK